MPESIVTVNLELGYPTVEEARQALKSELERCRNRKVSAIKVIHGYGSSGVGGALRQGLRKSLINRRKEGSVRAVVFGENWNIFDPVAMAMLEKFPGLSKDKDLCNCNFNRAVVSVIGRSPGSRVQRLAVASELRSHRAKQIDRLAVASAIQKPSPSDFASAHRAALPLKAPWRLLARLPDSG
jgi:hypothetical protein